MNANVEYYKKLIAVGKELLAQTDTNSVLSTAMDQLIAFSRAERGIIILFDGRGEILFETARKLKNKEIEHPEFEVSRTIIDQVKAKGSPLCFSNAHKHSDLCNSDAIYRLKVLSVICLPLKQNNKVFGVVYLDNRTKSGVFKPDIVRFIKAFVDLISVAAFCPLLRLQQKNRINPVEKKLRNK